MPYKTKHFFVKIEMKQSKDIGTNTKLVNYRVSAYKPFNNFQMTATHAAFSGQGLERKKNLNILRHFVSI